MPANAEQTVDTIIEEHAPVDFSEYDISINSKSDKDVHFDNVDEGNCHHEELGENKRKL